MNSDIFFCMYQILYCTLQGSWNSHFETKNMAVLVRVFVLETQRMKSQIKTINGTKVYWEKPVLEMV